LLPAPPPPGQRARTHALSAAPGTRAAARFVGLSRPRAPQPRPPPCSLPTLFLSECCLVYLPPSDAAALLAWAAAATDPGVPSAVAVYEMTRPSDAFGRTMIANLEVRARV
jgi:hypothetical protein